MMARMLRARWGNRSIEQRIADKTSPEPNTGCWLWNGATDRRGYAQIRIGGQTEYVTRVLLGLGRGDAMQALHRCDNGHLGCVNPGHLFAGTIKDNVHDMWRKGRQAGQWQRKTHCPRGHAYKRYASGVVKCLECERQWARLRRERAA